MEIYYNIITGFIFALIVIHKTAERTFEQFEKKRNKLGQVVLLIERYYLQHDNDIQCIPHRGEKTTIKSNQIIINIVPPRSEISRGFTGKNIKVSSLPVKVKVQ